MSATVDGDTSPPGPVRAVRPARRIRCGPNPAAVPGSAGAACTAVGLLDIAAGVLPRTPHGLGAPLPGPLAAALSLGAGVLLLLLAHGVRRRRRRAWRAAVVLLPAGAVASCLCRPSAAGVLLSLALLWLLVRHRGEFAAPPGPRSRWRALAHFVLMGAGSIALGLVIVSAHPGGIVGGPGLTDRLEHVMYGLFGVEGPVAYTGGAAGTVAYSLGTLGLLTAVTTLGLALCPAHPAARRSRGDEERLRSLLLAHGRPGSPAPLALRRDDGVVFSPSGRAAVRYRVVSGVMLAGGDPIGDVEAWPGAIERFMDEARARSWTPAVTGCSETGGEVWTRETGLDALEPGDGTRLEAGPVTRAARLPSGRLPVPVRPRSRRPARPRLET
ncbi:DUF2156 domain-containing protein [Streptomyces sp. t39]|nr:DUF2156 domain-containing protein [Streptomyces sp. t39]